MPTKPPVLRISNLPARHASAMKRKTQRLGLTVGDYIKELIEDDLALDHKAQTTPLDELAKPFRKALKGLSETEIDQIVAKNRAATPERRR
jgi:hypothetical protein